MITNNNFGIELFDHSIMRYEKLVIVGDMGKCIWSGTMNTIRYPAEGKRKIGAVTWSGKGISTHALYSGFNLSTFIKSLFETQDLEHEREERITFKEICYGEQALKLKSTVKVEGELSNKGWSFYYEPLDLLVSAPTIDECKEDFQEEFYVLYEEYAEEADEKLTKSAQELKRKLLNLVKVEP